MTHKLGTATLASTTYRLDAAGNRLRATHHDGSFNQWGYDQAYRIISESYVSGGSADSRYYGYSPGGDRLTEAKPTWSSFENSWSDDFERAELGSDYAAHSGTWAITGTTEKDLERTDTDTGAGMVTNTEQLMSKPFQLLGDVEPLVGTAAEPLSSALVFGWTAANNYFIAAARTWSAIPDGENEARLHAKYFIAHFAVHEAGAQPSLKTLAETAETEVLPLGTTSFQLRLRVTPFSAELARDYGSAGWDTRIVSGLPWGAGGVPSSRVGFYTSRSGAGNAKFDNLTLEWNTTTDILETASYVYDTARELTSVTGLGKDAGYTYDLDGNQATKTAGGVTTTFGYTFESRLQSVTRGGANPLSRTYTFQGDSWMRRRTTETNGSTTTTRDLLYDGDQLLAEFDTSNVLQSHYAGRGLDSALWTMKRNGSTFDLSTPLGDAQNVIAVANSSGAITSRYRYRAFGERFTLSGGNPARRDPSFQNRTYDAGLGIYDYRNRSFDPATGRFLQRDPVLGGDSLFNPYVFPGNNPVGNVDPMGTDLVVGEGKKKKTWTAKELEEYIKAEKVDEETADYLRKLQKDKGKPHWYAKRADLRDARHPRVTIGGHQNAKGKYVDYNIRVPYMSMSGQPESVCVQKCVAKEGGLALENAQIKLFDVKFRMDEVPQERLNVIRQKRRVLSVEPLNVLSFDFGAAQYSYGYTDVTTSPMIVSTKLRATLTAKKDVDDYLWTLTAKWDKTRGLISEAKQYPKSTSVSQLLRKGYKRKQIMSGGWAARHLIVYKLGASKMPEKRKKKILLEAIKAERPRFSLLLDVEVVTGYRHVGSPKYHFVTGWQHWNPGAKNVITTKHHGTVKYDSEQKGFEGMGTDPMKTFKR